MGKIIKVVWICYFSNKKLRSKLCFDQHYFINTIRKCLNHPSAGNGDMAKWNVNAVNHISKYNDIRLTVIMPYYGIKGEVQRFEMDGVKYVCFRSQDDHLFPFFKREIFKIFESRYMKNRRFIKNEILRIKPDIIHIMGAENPWYSTAAFDIPPSIPSIVSLQTLMSHPNFKQPNSGYKKGYEIRARIEKDVINKCDFIATVNEPHKSFIIKHIKPNARFLDLDLILGEESVLNMARPKQYDFVYFAANINKAGDLAIEAMGILCKKHPEATLNISGGYDSASKLKFDKRISELGIKDNVFFTGGRTTHQDVINQIQKSRFALLPLKVDLIATTILESMACGLPVVTTITQGTPNLNKDRQSVLLSEINNHQAMADNMAKLLEDDLLAERLKNNAFITLKESYSNESMSAKWHDCYFELFNNL